jgi:hypothetical protein
MKGRDIFVGLGPRCAPRAMPAINFSNQLLMSHWDTLKPWKVSRVGLATPAGGPTANFSNQLLTSEHAETMKKGSSFRGFVSSRENFL